MTPLIVDNAEVACAVLWDLIDYTRLEHGHAVALDTETTGCNPKKESPVGKARLWCMTLAWGEADWLQSAYVTREWLPAFKAWLESARHPKVGQNIYGYDRHVLANEGIRLRGIVGDTQRMSKLRNPANDGGHGLKDQARGLGFEMTDYEDVVGKKESIDVLWADPERRAKIIEYACMDAVATLAVYRHNAEHLKAVPW